MSHYEYEDEMSDTEGTAFDKEESGKDLDDEKQDKAKEIEAKARQDAKEGKYRGTDYPEFSYECLKYFSAYAIAKDGF